MTSGEDPCVNRLQEVTAQLLGKEAALYVPSGTMANQLCIKVHTQPGDEIIMERTNHPFNSESGALAASGVQVNLVDGKRGVITAAQVAHAIRHGDNVHNPPRASCVWKTRTTVVAAMCIPWTSSGRSVRWRGCTDSPCTLTEHNACAAGGLLATAATQYFDSCTLCLSKGLGAPVGSVLAGSADFIRRAHLPQDVRWQHAPGWDPRGRWSVCSRAQRRAPGGGPPACQVARRTHQQCPWSRAIRRRWKPIFSSYSSTPLKRVSSPRSAASHA